MTASRFDEVAATWDENPGRVEMAKQIVAAILRQAPVRPEMTAIDFGCGTGLVTLGLSEHVARITGIDNSAGMLRVLDEKIRTLGLDTVATCLVDLEHEPAPDIRADLIVSAMALHHIADVPALLRALAGMLNPGGHVALADLETEDGSFHGREIEVQHFGFDPAWMMAQLRELGFDDLRAGTAMVIEREERSYPVMLVSGRKP